MAADDDLIGPGDVEDVDKPPFLATLQDKENSIVYYKFYMDGNTATQKQYMESKQYEVVELGRSEDKYLLTLDRSGRARNKKRCKAMLIPLTKSMTVKKLRQDPNVRVHMFIITMTFRLI